MGEAEAISTAGFALAPDKEEIMNKCDVIFALVLSLAMLKVEHGLREPISGAVLARFVFSPCLVLTQCGIVWERWREKCISEEERGPHIMKSSTEISEGGGKKIFFACQISCHFQAFPFSSLQCSH